MLRFWYVIGAAGAAVVAGVLFTSFFSRRIVVGGAAMDRAAVAGAGTGSAPELNVPEAPQPTSAAAAPILSISNSPPVFSIHPGTNDEPPQAPLANPPGIVKAIYVTAWVAGSPARMARLIDLIKTTELNAVVIDIKDYSGYVSYAMDVPAVKASGAENQIRILRPNALVKILHENGIYVIGRITSFQDPVLAKAHPEWALHERVAGGVLTGAGAAAAAGIVWKDNHGLAWMDPAAPPVREYLAAIAKDAFSRGFDEVNFDYIRFASDGALGKISYPYWSMKTPRAKVVADYFKFLRETFPTQKISVDLFGLATVNGDDLGIGQVIESAYQYFDYVSPMVYPSHYAPGFLGYQHPAAHPYEVVNYSMARALARLIAMGVPPAQASSTAGSASSTPLAAAGLPPDNSQSLTREVPKTKLRPWLQDFNLGAPRAPGTVYTPQMVAQEKQAVYDSLDTATSSQYYDGWAIWDAANNYRPADFELKQ